MRVGWQQASMLTRSWRPRLVTLLRPRSHAQGIVCSLGRVRFRSDVANVAEVSEEDLLMTASALQGSGAEREGGDPGVRGAMREGGCVAAARHAFQRFGRFAANEKAWQGVTEQILTDGKQELSTMDATMLHSLVHVLAEDARVTRVSFWEELTEVALPVLERSTLQEAVGIAELYAKIQAWQRPVFNAAIQKVRGEMAMHWMKPADMVRLLWIFAKAGTGSRDVSVLSTQLFNEMEDRVLEDFAEFEPDDCVGLLSSMAHFRAEKVGVLQLLGREKLHAAMAAGDLHGPKAAEVCRAYGLLGWRHDTVFRSVAEEMIREYDALQRAKVLSEALPVVRYSASDLAVVAQALLNLKMYRGNTSWFKWGNSYQRMLDVLERRLESAELQTVGAEPLAAAAFVLGRGRRGTEDLGKSMYARMIQLLEQAGAAEERPQDHLERFLHGLSMMGPDRKKSLDAEWLMQWLCNNVYTFVLSDFIMVNRHLVALGCYDREYLQMLVPFYCDDERMKQLKKGDVMELTHTYNGARIREDDIPDGLGKHFFWALGRRFQALTVESRGPRRAPLRRLG